MDNDFFDRESDFLLVQGQQTEKFLSPIKQSSRLKYNCVSVSKQLVVFGANTGGIYVFSQKDQRLLQIAFADKETGSVSLVKISPHEKYVAFASFSNVHVLDLKLDSRSKVETLRSVTDFFGCRVTTLLWDQTSTKLFIGDDLGRVAMMPVYSNKAKNLFTVPLEVILKLDSAIVQIDKAEEKLLVSTMTRCYLCDTTKQQYSQIGKKLRDGQYGACFLRQGTSAPMVYCARPGSRIWEVDFEGSVLNTHQFKQLLAIPSSKILCLDQPYASSVGDYNPQSVAFPKLLVFRNHFLLTWTTSALYILDPLNVKVILWTKEFTDILDVCCVKENIFIFLNTMEIECITFTPVTSVIQLYLHVHNPESAAKVCLKHRNVFFHKHVRKKFGMAELTKVYDNLTSAGLSDIAEQIHHLMEDVEQRITTDSESEGSGRSRSQSAVSLASVSSDASGNIKKVRLFSENEMLSSANKPNMGSAILENGGPHDQSESETLSIETYEISQQSSGMLDTEALFAVGANDRLDNFIDKELEEIDGVVDVKTLDTVGIRSDDSVVMRTLYSKNLDVFEVNVNSVSAANMSESDVVNAESSSEQNDICERPEEIALSDRVNCEVNDFPRFKSGLEISNASVEHTDNVKHKVEAHESILEHTEKDGCASNSKHNSEGNISQIRSETIVIDTEAGIQDDKYPHLIPVDEVDSLRMLENSLETDGTNLYETHKRQREIEYENKAMTVSTENKNSDSIHRENESDFTENKGIGSDNTVIGMNGDDDTVVGQSGHYSSVIGDYNITLDGNKNNNTVIEENGNNAAGNRKENIVHESNNCGFDTVSFEAVSLTNSGHFSDTALENGDDLGYLPTVGLGTRKLSLTSLSSFDSADLTFDLPAVRNGKTSEEIAIPVKRKSSKKKRHKSPALETDHTPTSPTVKEGDSISLYSNDSVSMEDGSTGVAGHSDISRSLPKDKGVDSISVDSQVSNSGEYTVNEEFSRSEEFFLSGEYSPRDATPSPSPEKSRQGQTKAALMQLKNRVQTKVSSKTKTLIQNIKDKNLLTKAKEFAENFSQGPEAYLHMGEYHDLPDVRTPESEFEAQLGSPSNQKMSGLNQSAKDTSQSAPLPVQKPPIDLNDLEVVTMETKKKMQDVNILMDSKALYGVLFKWVSCLNKTFHQLHVMKYGLDENKDVNNLSTSNNLLKVENGRKGDMESKGVLRSDSDLLGSSCGNRGVSGSCVDLLGKVLKDKDFCYIRDPLHLSLDSYTDVCELAQACFDLGCYGNILTFMRFSNGACSNVDDKRNVDNSVVTRNGDENQLLASENKASDKESCAKATENYEDDQDKISKETCDISDSLSKKVASDRLNNLSSELITRIDDDSNTMNDRNKVTHEKTVNINLEEAPDNTDKEVANRNETRKHEKINVDVATDLSTVDFDEQNVADCGKDSCKEIGFFIRCYFPFLSVGKMRQQTLAGESCYETWCALVTCMEEKSLCDSERFGVDKKAVIRHLLEAQANTDQGALLLGHISKLFKENNSNLVDLCVRCYPYIRPLDVMYLCKYHQVAMETVFKDYMVMMTMDETSQLKKQVLSDVSQHLDVGLLWLDTLLSEESDVSKLMFDNGCPRCMSHRVVRKNQKLIEEFTSQILSVETEARILDMFKKHGFWAGVLKLLKKTGARKEHLKLVLQLGDNKLLSGEEESGYSAETVDDWEEVLSTFSQLLAKGGNQPSQEVISDWSSLITWNSLAVLLVRHVGPEAAVCLLEKNKVPEGVLSTDFYQSCLLAGMVHRQQRSVLHSMLEKVDTYLWSQRPVAVAPQVQYLAVTEKKVHSLDHSAVQSEHLQAMLNQIKENRGSDQFIEDSEGHWGVETKINQLCPCCYLMLKETVSHEEPGVLLFKCGHGYHKYCLPGKQCLQCEDATVSTLA